MTLVTASQLADRLGVSRGRVSQYVSEGKLDGCYSGEGRQRRFDLDKCAVALNRKLDLGQRMGNGAGTAEALQRMPADAAGEAETQSAPPSLPRSDPDADRYQKARADMAETRALKERLALAETEGRYVLASEVELNVRRAIAAELAEVESVLRSAAQTLAAEHNLPPREVKAVLFKAWRSHRQRRSDAAAARAETAQMTEAEQAELVSA